MSSEITNTVSVLNQIRQPGHSDENRHKPIHKDNPDQDGTFDTGDIVEISSRAQEDTPITEGLKPDLNSSPIKKQDDFTDEEKKELDDMKQRDREVRQHEQSHKAVAGAYGGAISYEFKAGPDGRRYAVGGEVSIDVSEVPNNPDATIAKAQVIKRAALAPAEPSGQDRQVAAAASRMEASARSEKLEEVSSENEGLQENTKSQNIVTEMDGENIGDIKSGNTEPANNQSSPIISAYNPPDTSIGTAIRKVV